MAGKALDGTSLTPEARVANNIVRISNEDGTAGTGFKMPMTDISLRDIQRTLNQAQALLASSGAAITAGQGYIIDNGGVLQLPMGVSLVRVVGINLPAGAKGFSANAEAYVTALSTWVACMYDVATNTISGKYIIWAGNISQSSGADATIDYTSVNLLGETPVFDATSTGTIVFTNTLFSFPQYKTLLFSPHIFVNPNLWSPSLEWAGVHELTLYMVKGDGSLADDIYNNTYIEISILF